ncbi:hypothetical protein EYF80_062438 [Liparis tanakae]|uniref:Uncharacterized protein n=1 Tax=Liparis tanakae TaxID=230148 RepID=A0A4Z2EFA0_9TELE|nr:hypothetical protein EYF80_062438 [Liparis tanakae]
MEDVELAEQPTRSADTLAAINKDPFENPAYGSDIEDVDVTSQPAASSTQQFESIGDDGFESFQNPTYMVS